MRTYKQHFACMTCRKAFRKPPIADYIERSPLRAAYLRLCRATSASARAQEEEASGITLEQIHARYLSDVSTCPQCGAPMASMGMDFRPPPQRAEEAWSIIRTLYEHGFAFKGCGCDVGYVPPARKSELPAWLRRHTPKRGGEALLSRIMEK
jgi:hypothetical protein